jgi:hypothetical protein
MAEAIRPVPASAPPAQREREQVREKDKPDTVLDVIPTWESEKTFKLTRRVHSHKNGSAVDIDQITLRAPLALDYFEVGGPPSKTNWNQGGVQVEMDIERTKSWILRLSNIDTPALYQLTAKDLRTMYDWLLTELQGTTGN